MKVAISQSNYIPWRGYFDMISSVDVFVIFDSVQYTKRDWRNRNKIKMNQGTKWLSVPVQNNSFTQSIDETMISAEDRDWASKHLKTLQMTYSKAKAFKEIFPWVEKLYGEVGKKDRLTDINEYLLREICDFLEIKTTIRRDTEFEIVEGKNERLLNICTQLGATSYLSGPAAKSYIDESLFNEKGIQVEWMNYPSYKEYPQLYGEFTPAVTILDLIFNVGQDAKNYLK
ncbi:WbqC family protein [Bergeyella zoohelcum]|uniref:WbqC-like protein family n=1 Tax=Bergeyella zoohelcum TaxID=1015 RepID=A0A7Z8YND7_9FLAO|nr:WbqC family protein [Bergeyella zoohelcum]VDH03435.1 WbqC-like protein family [Bergeyella zoohelcum]